MTVLNYYDGNQGISYPFEDGADMAFVVDQTSEVVVLSDQVVVDFGSVVGVRVDYKIDHDAIRLRRIRREADDVIFTFETTCAALSEYELSFAIPTTAERFCLQYSYGMVPASDSSMSGIDLDLDWTGFLVVGQLDSILTVLDPGQSMTADTGPSVEHRCVQTLYRGYVQSINLANHDRLRVTPSSDCGSPVDQSTAIIVNATDIIGRPGFAEGYNCFIELVESSNSIVIGADVGAGAGEPCEEIPLYAGESAPEGSELLTGGPKCKDTITSINGVSAASVKVEAGPGVRVYVDPEDASHLIVSIGLYDMIVCGTEE